MLFQQDVPLGLEVHNILSSSSLTPVGMIAKTAELFGRSALPTSIGPKGWYKSIILGMCSSAMLHIVDHKMSNVRVIIRVRSILCHDNV